ncbi:hypothetical protein SAMD00019534_087730 [Acytostelium subglobosum LB1]|uniref:hypothetical protein n=1 Tax=Acytostelium subglobosum LB1 TaxID=1410327 RepID=UPI000644A0BD|nr:hypothetical protein SAMD00019534_087730 [Acytostelium subglobosum LB1]GAM25598.1 hypothetical protein SAMD00019534_087730 [Acytostelium subglobosum LB1]|eukprot:XP_012751584.1 hypothetical protein SAMD00019534_087730 [Acytostelium subglobosum LB1]
MSTIITKEYMRDQPLEQHFDVLVVGAGHNGLVNSTFLSRAGLRVLQVEDKDIIGGCTKTEHPFRKVPGMGASTGAYLLGLMPPELVKKLDLDITPMRRDPHYFMPTTDGRYLLFGSDKVEMKKQFLQFFSQADWDANEKMNAELDMLREDIAPTWLQEPLSVEETAERFVRPALRQAFINLCRGTAKDYVSKFGFQSDLLRGMYVTTDGCSGLSSVSQGTGMNFLVHNMCRLPSSDGTWMIIKGGMGAVSNAIADVSRKAGTKIDTGRGVHKLVIREGRVFGAELKDGTKVFAPIVVINADPFRMTDLIGKHHLPQNYIDRIDRYRRDGMTMKVNLCLKSLPKFTCLPENKGQYGTTTHILPPGPNVMEQIEKAYAQAAAGILPEFPTIEWYTHTPIDPSIQDKDGHHNAALFVQWVPYTIKGSTWEAEEERYVKHLLSLVDIYAPGTSELVVDVFALPPPKLEKHFGITRGHIHHVDNGIPFDERLPYNTPIRGLYSCSAGCHPAGSVIGSSGHNSAMRILKDLKDNVINLERPAKL